MGALAPPGGRPQVRTGEDDLLGQGLTCPDRTRQDDRQGNRQGAQNLAATGIQESTRHHELSFLLARSATNRLQADYGHVIVAGMGVRAEVTQRG